MTEPPETVLTVEDALRLLAEGELSVEGRLVDASNATFYCAVELDGIAAACVYKPRAGERPLWDFPDGTLARREVAAYAVSEATGWVIVPPTVMRDGPFGVGMLQLWIDVDDSVDLVALARSDDPRLRRMAVFDAVVNNADRKGGHLLPTVDGQLYGVDHGVTFSVEDKLRTLLWQWRGRPLTDETRRGSRPPFRRPTGIARRDRAAAAEPRRDAGDAAAHPKAAGERASSRAVGGLAGDPVAAVLTARG